MRFLKVIVVLFGAVILGGCVSIQRYKADIALVNSSIAAQNANNQAFLELGKRIETKFKDLKLDVAYNEMSSRDKDRLLEKRIEVLDAFKTDHQKRWPPPVHLKSDPAPLLPGLPTKVKLK